MYETSVFKIKINFQKSHDSYIYDDNRRKYFLDFFGLYASLPLGYNHRIFSERNYLNNFCKTASIKIANCEVISDEGLDFLSRFRSHPAMKSYKHFWFCCTGALAVETAIKAAIDDKQVENPVVISLKESFHGINGYGSFVTDNFPPVSMRLEFLPKLPWPKVNNPKIIYMGQQIDEKATEKGLIMFEDEIRHKIAENKGKVVALLVEPIQATFGDNYFPLDFFKIARKICDQEKIALIFDEVQTGFGSTGKMWFWQNTEVEPDIVVFGKKSQVAGIMAKDKFGQIFKHANKLSVTFDGDLSDMIRCSQILKAYQKYNILKKVNDRGEELKRKLQEIKELKNVRGMGLMLAFDFNSHAQQLKFAKLAFKSGLIFNRTREKTIRLRPNLNVSSKEIDRAVAIIKSSV